MKRSSSSLVIREMQIKTTMRYHLTQARMAVIKKSTSTSLVAQMVKHLSTMRETRVRALGWEDPLEKEMAIHSSTVAWKIPWTEEPGRLQSMGSQRVGHDWATSLSLSSNMISYLGISSSVLCKFESEVGGTAQLHLTASETQMQMNTFRDWWESHFSSHRAKPNKDCHWHTHTGRVTYALWL